MRIHDLRHTHAAWLLSSGTPIFVVQKRLGHSSSATMTDVYGHLTPEGDEQALAVLDRYLPEVVVRDEEGTTRLTLTAAEKQLPQFDIDDFDDLAA